MKKLRFLSFICPIIALIAEITPYGAVLNFGNPDGEHFRETYSYFDLTPFGYANSAPLTTAILTCLILVITVFFAVKPKRTAAKTLAVLSLTAFIIFLAPLLFGVSFFSPVGAIISAALLINSVIMFMLLRCI